jgi:hypothetical protein
VTLTTEETTWLLSNLDAAEETLNQATKQVIAAPSEASAGT